MKIMTKTIANKVPSMLLLLLCILGTIDSNCFSYPSMSKYLAFSICSLIILSIIIFNNIWTKRYFYLSGINIILSLWICYIIVHNYFVPGEAYRSIYLISGLLLSFGLSQLLKINNISFELVENALLLIAIIHIIFIFGQYCGFIASGSIYFKLTGSNENPNITAIYLSGCMPLLIKRIKGQHHAKYILLSIAIVISIIVLKCRSAYIALIIISIIELCYSKKLKAKLFQYNNKCKTIIGISALTIIIITSLGLYLSKKDSSDGRLLIWKISIGMLYDNAIGYGYGMFEGNYNIKQAEYFSLNKASETEQRTASYVYMPYNDYLEHGLEGGLIGATFLFLLYITLIRKAYLYRQKEALSVFVSFAIISTFNFIYTSIQPWLLLLCYCAYIIKEEKVISLKTSYKISFISIFLIITISLLYKITGMTYSQYVINKNINSSNEKIQIKNVSILLSIKDKVQTSELYWRCLGNICMSNKEYAKAIEYYENALAYTSIPDLHFRLCYCYKMIGNEKRSIQHLRIIKNMLPLNLKSRIWLMRYYHSKNQTKQAVMIANEIINMPIKIISSESEKLKKEALNYLNKAK